MKPILAVIGAVGLYGGSIIAALAETDKNACYGETLDVILQVYEPTDDEDGEVQFALPNPASWNAERRAREGGGWLRDLECLEEPILITEVYGSAMRGKFQAAIGWKPGDLEKVGMLALTGGYYGELVEAGEKRNRDRFEGQWQDIPFGFSRLDTDARPLVEEYFGRKFTGGLIRFPDNYQSPLGLPLETSCSGFGSCQIRYRAYSGMLLHYRFGSSLDYEKRWIPQDQAVRKLIESWMVNPTPNH
ncbi:hypothetical protein MUY35_07670 [Aliiroseovarius sp. S1339]|uniref:hypothetical protein n=1 Tax=Aliiroseovarius sp. S1339 TaxID=2936990 RepID=UPI0020C16799|nr:hypothetical protein [Aliiroseovarius sp. S1339]MCK8463725.1 hypothetical protein [Aliiroseovarius sp. S1339]